MQARSGCVERARLILGSCRKWKKESDDAFEEDIFFDDYDTPRTLDLTIALAFGLLPVYLAPEILA